MSDVDLRELERAWKASGLEEDAAPYLAELERRDPRLVRVARVAALNRLALMFLVRALGAVNAGGYSMASPTSLSRGLIAAMDVAPTPVEVLEVLEK